MRGIPSLLFQTEEIRLKAGSRKNTKSAKDTKPKHERRERKTERREAASSYRDRVAGFRVFRDQDLGLRGTPRTREVCPFCVGD